jgi:isocitrate lyase
MVLLLSAQGRCIHEATKHIPIIGDGDTGYGNAMNVKRTVRGYAAAGFAGEAGWEGRRGLERGSGSMQAFLQTGSF